jgi:predicted DNA-binding protein
MPAANPRITITLKPEVHEVLKRLSSLTGNSQSSMVGEILNDSFPVFERMVQVLSAAEKMRADAMKSHQEIGRGLKLAHGRIERQLGLSLVDLEESFLPILEAADEVDRRAATDGQRASEGEHGGPSGGARRGSTPISNRGVRSTPEAKKKGSKEAGQVLAIRPQLPEDHPDRVAEETALFKAKVCDENGWKVDADAHRAYAASLVKNGVRHGSV